MYENWTDVSGFLTADPRIVDNPKSISRITYAELRELSYMGASVLHEEAIFPVKDAGIPLVIKNTNAPDDPGTVISEETEPGVAEPLITGIAGKKDFVAIHVKTNHMSSKVGYIRKTLSIFERYRVSIEHIPTGIDSFAVVVQGSDVTVEYDKLIDRQLERAAISTIAGFAKIFDGAVKAVSYTS